MAMTINGLRSTRKSGHREMVYFLVSYDGRTCYINKSTNLYQTLANPNIESTGMQFHGFIEGNGNDSERHFHDHFWPLHVKDKQALFRVEGELARYLNHLAQRAWFGTELKEIDQVYPYENRFPWNVEISVDLEPKLFSLNDREIAPGVMAGRPLPDRMRKSMSSESHDWITPGDVAEAARMTMGGIDLDPASCSLSNLSVRADHIYTLIEDGLSKEWHGKVWLNPPYGKAAPRWSKHLMSQYEAGNVQQAVACFSSNAMTTMWFQPFIPYPMVMTIGRINFLGGPRKETTDEEKADATTGKVFVYLGPDVDKFDAAFGIFGNKMGLR